MSYDHFHSILAFAIRNEIEAQEFYRNVAARMTTEHLKELFTGFAKEEKHHQEILEKLTDVDESEFHFDTPPDYHVAESMDKPVVSDAMQPADAFALAMKREEEAMKLYQSFAQAATDPAKKNLFQELAMMEKNHKLKMENAFVNIGFPEVW
jgi:rubrerythrin